LGYVAGTLSFALLVEHSMKFGYVAPLKLLLDFYEQFLNTALGWLGPYLKEFVDVLKGLIGVDMHLNPAWRHSFVACTSVCATIAGFRLDGDRLGSWNYVVWVFCGVVLGLGFGLSIGVSDDDAARRIPLIGTLMLIPVMAVGQFALILLYSVIMLLIGSDDAREEVREFYRGFSGDALSEAWPGLAVLMAPFVAVAGVLVFLALNAGLKLAGL